MLRVVDFHIKRSFSLIGRSGSGASKSVASRIGSILGGRLPNEEYYFDELVKALDLERVSIGTEAMERINATVFAEKCRMESRLLNLIRDKNLVRELVSKIDVIDTSSLNVYVLGGTHRAVVCEVGDGNLVIMTEGKSAENLLGLVRTELEKISKRSAFSGYVLDRFVSGAAVVQWYLARRSDIVSVSKGKPKSLFEKIVHGEVEQVVDSFMQNAVIKFRASGETEEYDCLVVLGPEIAYDIEVTDYSSVRAEIERRKKDIPFIRQTLKSTILIRSQQKAERIGAKALVIAKGFPESTLKDLSRIGNEIGVTLISEHNINARIEEILIQATIAATTSRTPLRSPRELSEAIRHGKFEI